MTRKHDSNILYYCMFILFVIFLACMVSCTKQAEPVKNHTPEIKFGDPTKGKKPTEKL